MKTRSYVLSARVDAATRGRLYRAARERNAPISTLIRAAVTAIATERDYEAAAVLLGQDYTDAPEKTLTEIKALLGLGDDVSPAAIKQALDDLLAALEPANDPAADVAEVPPLPSALARRAWARAEAELVRKHVLVPAARARRAVAGASAARLTVAERVYCEREKITPAEFAARKARAVKRDRDR
jgi:hypothetical protein